MRSGIVRTLVLLAAARPLALPAQQLVTPEIPGVVVAGTPVEVVKDDFRSTEGPVGMPDGSLLFTETRASVIQRIAPDGTASVYLENTGLANGLGFDRQGRLIAAQHGGEGQGVARIGIIAPAGEERVLVDGFQGRPFVRPNDLVVDARGGVYFTDPAPRPADPGGALETPSHVYYLRPDGRLVLLDDRMRRPNGIQLSPDGWTLYVADTILEDIIAFDVMADGSVANGRVFAKIRDVDPAVGSGADGMAMDADGRLYSTSSTGVQVFDPRGEHLGTIPIPRRAQNVAFAGPDRSWLYVVGAGGVYRVQTRTRGVEGRAK